MKPVLAGWVLHTELRRADLNCVVVQPKDSLPFSAEIVQCGGSSSLASNPVACVCTLASSHHHLLQFVTMATSRSARVCNRVWQAFVTPNAQWRVHSN